MADLDRRRVGALVAVCVGFFVLVIVVGRSLLIADAWPGGWRWWFAVSALAAVIVILVAIASGRRRDGRRTR